MTDSNPVVFEVQLVVPAVAAHRTLPELKEALQEISKWPDCTRVHLVRPVEPEAARFLHWKVQIWLRSKAVFERYQAKLNAFSDGYAWDKRGLCEVETFPRRVPTWRERMDAMRRGG